MSNRKTSGVYQLKNGYWAYRFCSSKDGKQVSVRSTKDAEGYPLPTKAAAEKARIQAIEDIRLGRDIQHQKVTATTIAEVFQEYLDKRASERAYATVRKQKSLWKNHISEIYGDRILDSINPAEINDYLADLYYNRNYSYRYVESFLKFFYLIFGQAYSRGYLTAAKYNRLCSNKDIRIQMPKPKNDENMDVTVFSREQCDGLDAYFKDTNAEIAYLLGRYCGLRINECYGLRWCDVNLDEGVIHIRRQMAYQQGVVKLTRLKTKHAYRDIYMNERLLTYLKQKADELAHLPSELQEQRKQREISIPDIDGTLISSLEFVNTLPNGKLQTINSMKYHSRMIKQQLGFVFKYHFLRHTYGTFLANANVPQHVLCNQMGHGGIHVTQRYYLSISEASVDILKEKLSNI